MTRFSQALLTNWSFDGKSQYEEIETALKDIGDDEEILPSCLIEHLIK